MLLASISISAGFASFPLNDDELSISLKARMKSKGPLRLAKPALLFWSTWRKPCVSWLTSRSWPGRMPSLVPMQVLKAS